ncbi:hypothetical protein AB0J55_11310 [Amycolatopsis sp. NPDC049688]|uniref:hypothetical protein n=1 Tax=Amycolatopsis sp. NPDC049688 TaxID=3154733 RepID=UPI0034217023
MSKRIDDGTKVGDTGRKHKRHSPFARIRFGFDNGLSRRIRRNCLMTILVAAQRRITGIQPAALGAFPGTLDHMLTRL